MSPRRRSGRRILTALLPLLLVLVLAMAGLTAWLTYGASHPPHRAYLVTPEKFEQLSDRGLQAAEENWENRDGTRARGWLLRGREGSPAVVLLHGYGADRSWLLNLGVKLNEAADMTVLLPDMRGHGEEPAVSTTAFGIVEAADVLAAVGYLKSLTTPQGRPLVGQRVGLYGFGMGAYAALLAARDDESIHALALDSVPASPDDVLHIAVREQTGFDNSALQMLARGGARLFFAGEYRNTPACEIARQTLNRQVLLLSGPAAGPLRDSTTALSTCFPPGAKTEAHTDLPVTGFTLASASGEQGETYDRRVIEFFGRALGAGQ